MDDPWANAWGEPSKPQTASSSWSAPVSRIHGDHEDDISTPSWPVEPITPSWNESGVTEASIWSNELSSTWQPAHSTFDNIPLTTVSAPPPQFPTSISKEPEKPVTPRPSDTPPPSSPLLLSPPLNSLHLSRPSTPDVFGTFKSADEFNGAAHESWSPAKPTFLLPSADANAWSLSWSESNETNLITKPGTADELDHAWESAKGQKERQDRHVPPELLASILLQLEEMSGELWPDIDAFTTASENGRSLDIEAVVPASIAQRFMSEDMTLQSNVLFAKSFISKQMTEALKLTKHAPQTRLSPMAMYMSSKGSTSWETSIKSQPNITHDDLAPAGWKIVETPKGNTVVDEGKKRAGGGLLSFFGRRTTISQADVVPRSTSPAVNNPIISSLKTGSSAMGSDDNVESTTTVASSQGSGRTTPALPVAISLSSSIPTQKNDANPTASSAASDTIVREPTPPSSAVSRFLDRFSSRRSKPRDSSILSQDDLEFLSDVPTLNESQSNQVTLDTLSMMIKSPPLSTTLPPPLAPPPPSQPIRTLSQATKFQQEPMNDDPFSIFNSSASVSHHTHSSMKPLTAASTPLGAPLLDLSLSSTSLSAHSGTSGSTISNQGCSSFGLSAPPNNSCTPPPIPKPNTTLSQGSSSQNQWLERDSLASGSTGVISPLPPPPESRSRTPSHTVLSPSVQVAVNSDDDDDFSDFLSSPAQSPPPVPPSLIHNVLAMNLAKSSCQIPTTTDNVFDGLDDFLGPFSSDPKPPQPPAKPKSQSPFAFAPNFSPSNDRRTPSTQSSPRQHSRTVSKADHSRTLSLLENVAARGRWLGPATPLPDALPPPANPGVKSSGEDLFSFGSTMQVQQAQAAAALSASLKAPTLGADEKNRSLNISRQSTAHLYQLPMSSQPSLSKPLTLQPSSANATVTPVVEVKNGGLSAQELSFFEGL